MVSLNRPPGEKPSHQSLRKGSLYNTLVLHATTKVGLQPPKYQEILRGMKNINTVVAVIIAAAAVLALINHQVVTDLVLPIIHNIW